MRGAAASLELIVERLSLNIVMPSFSAIRWWLIRFGCYALLCPLPQREQWVWLIDHTVQIGAAKLLIVVGCLLSDVPFGKRDLQHEDLRLIHLALMDHSTAETMAVELEQAALRTGNPREIVSDQGSDLIGGVQIYKQQADIIHAHDMAHQAANILKQRWNRDDRWSTFSASLSQTGARLRQTFGAAVRPPSTRAKARFMNVGPTLRFAGRVLKLLETSTNERIEKHYGWLREYRGDVLNWVDEQAICELTVRHVSKHGVNRDTAAKLETMYAPRPLTAGVHEVAERLTTIVRETGVAAEKGETLVGSTEVLESILGKLKRLEGSYANDGFTGLALALGAIVGKRSEAQACTALEAVPQKVAESTIGRIIGNTVHSLRNLFARITSVPDPG